ncbi:MAG: cation transporter [Fimbriimonadaceae bacterium]|nr:cation transporter [Fimbriimonadaceae bacterium]QYK56036.1 MAG: cation transporter [Fimbriimonadaceae bacterium]
MTAAEKSVLAQRAAAVSLLSTVLVVAFKGVASGLSGSIAVLAEAIQSMLDVAVSAASLWTIRIAAEPPDRDHPFGHGKAEDLLSAFQMVLVVVSAGVIAWQAALRLHDPKPIEAGWGIAAMAYAALANTAVRGYLIRTAKRADSAALRGEAEHLRGDTFASLGVLVGLVATRVTGLNWMDPAVALAFTGITAFLAIRHLLRALHPLMDGALPRADLQRIERVLAEHPAVRGHHALKTRQSGSKRIVQLHIMLDDHLTFIQAHDLAEEIEAELSQALGGAETIVHYEPYEEELRHQQREHHAEPDLG